MLMFDRITAISEEGGEYSKGLIRAEYDINPDLWFFACHFEGDPVMPGCLGLDAMWQLLGFYLGWLGEPGNYLSDQGFASRPVPDRRPDRNIGNIFDR